MNNNEFNMNNPFLSNDNNQQTNNMGAVNQVPNTTSPVQSIPSTTPVNTPVENTDAALGINQYGTHIEESPEKEKELDSILGLNGNNNEVVENMNTNINNNENTVEDLPKAQKTLHNDFLVLMMIQIVIIVLSFTSNEYELNIFNIVYAVLTGFGFLLTLNNSKNSWIVGLIIGAALLLSIIEFDIIDALLGLFVIIHSIMCLIETKKGNTKTT